MKIKLNFIAKLVLFIEITIIFIVLYSLTQIYNPGLQSLEALQKNMHQMHTLILESEYPFRVLKNTSNLPDTRRSTPDVMNLYNTRKHQIQENLDLHKLLSLNSMHRLDDFNYYLVFQHKMLDNNIQSLIRQLKVIMQVFPDDLSEYTLLMVPNRHEHLVNLNAVSKEYIMDIQKLTNQILDDYIESSQLYFTFFFYVLLLFGILQTIIIIRLLNFEKKYIFTILKILKTESLWSNTENMDKRFLSTKPIFEEELRILKDTSDYFKLQEFIRNIEVNLQTEYEMDHLLNALFESAQDILSYDRIGIAFVDLKNQSIRAEHGVTHYDNILLGPGFSVPISETSLGDVLKNKKSFITHDLMELYTEKPHSASLSLITQEGMRSNLVVPIIIQDKVYGFTFFSSKETGHFVEADIAVAENITKRLSGSLMRSYMIKLLFSQMISSFSSLVDNKDTETGDHLFRMSQYSKILTQTLYRMNLESHKVEKGFIQDMEIYSRSHDIGKIGIPDKILKKPGRLTHAEFDIIKKHPLIGGNVFKDIMESLSLFEGDYFITAQNIALYHHEKWDGSGYPEGLKEYEIPLSARIVAVADVFDALCSKRVYKDAMSIDEAVDIIISGRGKHFDPIIIDAFLISLDELIQVSDHEQDASQSYPHEEVQ